MPRKPDIEPISNSGENDKRAVRPHSVLDNLPSDLTETGTMFSGLFTFFKDIQVLLPATPTAEAVQFYLFDILKPAAGTRGLRRINPDLHAKVLHILIPQIHPSLDTATLNRVLRYPLNYVTEHIELLISRGVRKEGEREVLAERLQQLPNLVAQLKLTESEFMEVYRAVKELRFGNTDANMSEAIIFEAIVKDETEKFEGASHASELQFMRAGHLNLSGRWELFPIMLHAISLHRQGVIDVTSVHFKRLMKDAFPLLPSPILAALHGIVLGGEVEEETE